VEGRAQHKQRPCPLGGIKRRRDKFMGTSRKDAGLVEQDYETQVQDETVESGENAEHLEENSRVNGGSVLLPAPSLLNNPYMSPEEQDMQMEAQIVGPPQYGSPDPTTSAGKLAPLSSHPLAFLPEDHPSAISESYGETVSTTLEAGETTHHGTPQRSDLELDSSGQSHLRARTEDDYSEMKAADLKKMASRRGIEGYSGMNKDELVQAHVAYDEAQATDEDSGADDES
jgi:hypothetical protein